MEETTVEFDDNAAIGDIVDEPIQMVAVENKAQEEVRPCELWC